MRKQRAEDRARAHAEAQKSTPTAGSDPTSDPFGAGGGPFGAGGGGGPFGAGGGPFGGGGGGGPFGGGIPGLDKLLEDPEVMELFSDPGKWKHG